MSKGAEGRWREEMGMRRTFSTYGAKMRQANREAVATVVALARCVFADFNLDDDAEVVAGAATAGATDAEGEEARRG